MWSRIVLALLVGLLLLKAFFPKRLAGLKAQLDRVVNLLLVALAVGYGIVLALRIWGGDGP
jgi:Flp pilus assembly protein TadB